MKVSRVDHLQYDPSCVEWNVKPCKAYLLTKLVIEVALHDIAVVNDRERLVCVCDSVVLLVTDHWCNVV